ncbi:MerR family transcriptional regulator [Kribbella qitaiheensis]|uniref:MerR family transcriptional regulator n=1 Tax=Kribbella qitaiheensis TaxID=1544730 RepID=A0A7G6X1D1_9ACTN|nr:MerR family transcriptional regulator [Kribbella qitaiheensis]QNE20046.1 MerR family transcriptional regulator [Kribbella qitaiheensis]
MNTDDRTWRIGELAKATGVSMRSLHHYDAIGLLQPIRCSGAGHRLYSGADVRRLHRVVALRGFGLTLPRSVRCWTANSATRGSSSGGSWNKWTSNSRRRTGCGGRCSVFSTASTRRRNRRRRS